MEQELEELAEEEKQIVERMVEIKMEMKSLDSVEKENEIKERKVELFDLSEKREQCLSKVRELERDMIRWRKEADLERVYLESTLPDRASPDVIRQLLMDCLEQHFGSLSAVVSQQNAAELALKEMKAVLKRYETKL